MGIDISQGKASVENTRYKSHGKGAGRSQQSVLRIHVGYRSLIDWQKSSSWKDVYSKSIDGISPQAQGWMGKGPAAAPGSSNTIGGGGGSIGAAWNVKNPNVPSFGGGQTGVRDAFGSFTPMWLYRLSEIAEHSGGNLSNIESEIGTEKAGTAKATVKSGESQIGIRKGGYKKGDDGKIIGDYYYGTDVKGEPIYKTNKKGEKYQVKERLGAERELVNPSEENAPSAWKMLPLLRGKHKNYTTSFANNVLDNIGTTIPTQMDYLKQEMLKRADSSGKKIIEQATTRGRDIKETGGQTITEKMGELGGASYSPDPQLLQKGERPTRELDPMGEWGGSNPIDLTFKREISVGAKKDKTSFTKADTTTSTYQKGSHHGIGLTELNAPVEFNKKQLQPLRKKIMGEQNKRIDVYNKIIRTLKGLEYGTRQRGQTIRGDQLDLVALRRKIATEHLASGKSDRRYAYDNNQALLEESQQKRSMAEVKAAIRANIEGESDAQLNKALEHVLHAIGTYAGGEMWASMMNLDVVYPQNQPGLATLLLNYGWTEANEFQKLQMNNVQIIEDSVVHWIYKHRDDSNKELRFHNLVNAANESMAVEGYASGSATGTLVAAVNTNSARIHETAHMAMPIEGALAGVIDDVTTGIVMDISERLESKLGTNLIKEATRYSKQMRNPTTMGRIPEWMDAFGEAFLGVEDYMKGAGGDAFSFLWATPYVSTIFPRLGGAEQYTGSMKGPRGA